MLLRTLRLSGILETLEVPQPPLKYAFANGRAEALPGLADEMLRSGVDVIVSAAPDTCR